METIRQWTVFERAFEAGRPHDNPYRSVRASARFRAPSGRVVEKELFWDGGAVWRVRFSPDETGPWTWETECTEGGDDGLDGKRGGFACVAHTGELPVHRHGGLRLSADRRHLAHADGTPFFWLADTAWNGVLKAADGDWADYLRRRREQGFTAIQFVSTQWRAFEGDEAGRTPFSYGPPVGVDPSFFREMDARVAAINAEGLVAAPVLIWSCTAVDPGQRLPVEEAERLARYIVARWGAFQVVWLLGGDGRYRGGKAANWKRIGRAVFPEPRDRLVSMHPCGQASFAEEFRGENWFDFNAYQSGHGASPRELCWLLFGPYTSDWRAEPVRPSLNLEPNYEGHPDYQSRQLFTQYHVRRAAYWSLLTAPPAGVTYGTNPVWCWQEKAGPHPGHAYLDSAGPCAPWREWIDTPGAACMTVLRRFFEALPWWELRPAPELLDRQPGFEDPVRFIAAARSPDRHWAVVYAPRGGEVALNPAALQSGLSGRWFDPRTGDWREAAVLDGSEWTFKAPDGLDWLLVLGMPPSRAE